MHFVRSIHLKMQLLVHFLLIIWNEKQLLQMSWMWIILEKIGIVLCEVDCQFMRWSFTCGCKDCKCTVSELTCTSFSLMGLKVFLLSPFIFLGSKQGFSWDSWHIYYLLLSEYSPETASAHWAESYVFCSSKKCSVCTFYFHAPFFFCSCYHKSGVHCTCLKWLVTIRHHYGLACGFRLWLQRLPLTLSLRSKIFILLKGWDGLLDYLHFSWPSHYCLAWQR